MSINPAAEEDGWYEGLWHAPKDGTRILLYGPVGNGTNMQFTANWETSLAGKAGWRIGSAEDGFTLWFTNPTQWRPLPPDPVPPKEI